MNSRKPHDYNYDDYNDDNDDDYNTIMIAPDGDDDDQMDSVLLLAKPLEAIEGGLGPQGKLPARWTYAKITLFDNAAVDEVRSGKRRLKLALSVKTAKDAKFRHFTASMNSPFRNLKRGLSAEEYQGSHYQLMQQLYTDAKQSGRSCWVSKFHITGDRVKGRTVRRLSALLVEMPKDGRYLAVVVAGDDEVYFDLGNGDLTQRQRRQGAIAQAHISSGIVTSPDIDDII